MQHCHKTIEHLGGNGLVNVSVLIIIHLVGDAAGVATCEHLLDEDLDLLLVVHSVLVTYVFTLSFSIQAFSVLGSELNPRKSSLTGTTHSIGLD